MNRLKRKPIYRLNIGTSASNDVLLGLTYYI